MDISRENFAPKLGTIKDRNGRDLVEAEAIKKRWEEYMEELYKNDLNKPDNRDVVVSHQEPDILECEVKWSNLISLQRQSNVAYMIKKKKKKEAFTIFYILLTFN